MDTNKAQALLEWEELGEITLSEWEVDFLTGILEAEELGRDVWTENQAAKVEQIYLEKSP